jgi:hypothetical protein
MDKIKAKLDECGGILKAILLILAVLTALLAWDSRLAKVSDLQAQEAKTVKTLEQFEQRQDRKYLEQRQQTLTDQMMTQKQMMKKYPKDAEVKEDYEAIKEERDKVKEELKKK